MGFSGLSEDTMRAFVDILEDEEQKEKDLNFLCEEALNKGTLVGAVIRQHFRDNFSSNGNFELIAEGIEELWSITSKLSSDVDAVKNMDDQFSIDLDKLSDDTDESFEIIQRSVVTKAYIDMITALITSDRLKDI